ncbi:VCBS domain-containing protein [Flexibacterium corallicola]|uniref:VCBS domain-containing protein n=1 Tax=Flexibacterium corallicola TaxID=3037259 RepID=UPI00286F3D55|nr:VCBS domain-containing protein [Pseudovibrio sp. M1P-2-3]
MPNTAPISYPVIVNANEHGVVSIRVIFQDADLLDGHSLILNNDEMIGTGTVIDDDTFHYDPGTAFDYLAAGETTTDTFTYTVTDSAGESSSSTVTITVTGQNDGPVAVALEAETDENAPVVVAPEFTDLDTNDTHTFTVDTTDTIGLVIINEDGTFSYDPNGQFDHLNAGETATDTFTYTVTDSQGESSTETITVTVNGLSQNTPPTTYPVEMEVSEDGTIKFRIIFEDPDVFDTHTYSVNTDGMEGVLTETEWGVFLYTPNPAFDYLANGETAIDTFTYTVTDNHGGSHTSTTTITVIGENDAPVASSMEVTTTESSAIDITPDFVDPDINDTHTFTVDTTSTTGTVIINDDGTFTYNPNGQFDALNNGESATDTFSYTVTDSEGESSTETVTITVEGESELSGVPFKLVASDGEENDLFGKSHDLNDHGVVVVASNAGTPAGVIYVYTPDDDGYSEERIVPSDTAGMSAFGRPVVVNNSGVIAVGARGTNIDQVESTGAIYVYTPQEDGGYSEVKLTASDGEYRDYLGHMLSMNENGVIIASGPNNEPDDIYIFTPDGSGNYTETKLPAFYSDTDTDIVNDITVNDQGVVFAGGSGEIVHIFTPDGAGGYTEMQLAASSPNSQFGRNGYVQANGTIVVTSISSIFFFEPDGEGNYSASRLATGSGFGGYEFSINDSGVIVVGAPSYSFISSSLNKYQGVAYVYVPNETGGYDQITLSAFDKQHWDFFGQSVSINEDGIITVGAWYDDDKGEDSGSVYIFVPDENGNYVGADGTVYEPSDTPPVMQTYGVVPLEFIGNDAAETFLGGDSADTINGNGGDDIITGGAGDDQLTGGTGNDIFVFNAGDTGHDIITDFTAGAGSEDVIEFETAQFADFDTVLAAAADVDGDTVITIDADTSVTLTGVQVSDLHQDDFLFV